MQALKQTAVTQVVILFACVAAAWSVELVDRVAYGGSLERFGIHPRDVAALWGILAAPLLHGGWAHLAANTLPFIVLSWLVMLRRLLDFVVVTAYGSVGQAVEAIKAGAIDYLAKPFALDVFFARLKAVAPA